MTMTITITMSQWLNWQAQDHNHNDDLSIIDTKSKKHNIAIVSMLFRAHNENNSLGQISIHILISLRSSI